MGRLTGRIVLPVGFDQARFEGARIELAETANPLEVIRLATLEMTEPVASDDGPRQAQSFLIADLPAGRYVLTTFVPGFRAERDGQSISPLPVELDIGRNQDLGDIQLVLDESPNVQGAVVGQAELQGATNHRGILVEARGTPYRTETTSEGNFRLELPAGTYDLSFK